ncbi:MAG: hypothetical protein EXS05_12390 [Planctomycetaceae bacterium]|nr:hypothetical protein [Planctomycetaceae bacterium]
MTTTIGKLTFLDAAAAVLQEAGRPLSIQGVLDATARKGYYVAPENKTINLTLSSIIRQNIARKGADSRFQLVGQSMFGISTVKMADPRRQVKLLF